MKVQVTSTTGNENLSGASAKVCLFLVLPNGDEVPLGRAAASHPHLVTTTGAGSRSNAVPGVRPEIGGQWTAQNHAIEEGSQIKIYATRKRSWNSVPESGVRYFRINSNGPLLNIVAHCSGHNEAAVDTVIALQGRLEPLPAAELPRNRWGEMGACPAPNLDVQTLEPALHAGFTQVRRGRSGSARVAGQIVQEVTRIMRGRPSRAAQASHPIPRMVGNADTQAAGGVALPEPPITGTEPPAPVPALKRARRNLSF